MSSILLLVLFFHPMHISVCEINFNAKSKNFEFSQRIFLDDLELALNKENHSNYDLTHPKSKVELDSIIKKYLLKKVGISVANKKLKLEYVGYEVEEGVYWIYYESSPLNDRFQEISVRNTALFELYDDQSTILQVKMGDSVRAYRLHDNVIEEKIAFNGGS